mmetsp:Transcript_5036/g.14476  ORF Transcript_5036/g.14476 Transcript_5036/m.14476 type:complete len:238 (-) Transcript_5036:620-1333(-)
MACPINVVSVEVLDNPAPFTNPLSFLVTYECLYQLNKDLEWRLTYVGDAESESDDQVLDSVLVGPVYPGQYRFVFQADPPDHTKLPQDDILGITALLLTCLYADKEFVRVGYYVNNEYPEEEVALREEPPKEPIVDKLIRNILADKPRVTKFPIDWDPPVDDVPSSGTELQQGFGVEGGTGDDMMDSPQRNFGGGQLAAQFAAAADEDGMQQPSEDEGGGLGADMEMQDLGVAQMAA